MTSCGTFESGSPGSAAGRSPNLRFKRLKKAFFTASASAELSFEAAASTKEAALWTPKRCRMTSMTETADEKDKKRLGRNISICM